MTGEWFVAQSRPQYEKKLAREFEVAGINHFLPVEEVTHYTPTKKKRIQIRPIFPLYVFFNGDESDRYFAACSDSTMQILPRVVNQAKIARQLFELETTLTSRPGDTALTYGLRLGDICKPKTNDDQDTFVGVLVERPDNPERPFGLRTSLYGSVVVVPCNLSEIENAW